MERERSNQVNSRTDTPGYRKCSPYLFLSARLAATLILHCNLLVRRAQSQPTDAPSLRSNSLSVLVSALSVLIFTSITVRYFRDSLFFVVSVCSMSLVLKAGEEYFHQLCSRERSYDSVASRAGLFPSVSPLAMSEDSMLCPALGLFLSL